MPPSKKPPEYKPRKCKYCKLIFVPIVGKKGNRRNAEVQKFCCANHRYAYRRNGGLNWQQLTDKLEMLVEKLVKQELQKQAEAFRTEMRNAIAMQVGSESRPAA